MRHGPRHAEGVGRGALCGWTRGPCCRAIFLATAAANGAQLGADRSCRQDQVGEGQAGGAGSHCRTQLLACCERGMQAAEMHSKEGHDR